MKAWRALSRNHPRHTAYLNGNGVNLLVRNITIYIWHYQDGNSLAVNFTIWSNGRRAEGWWALDKLPTIDELMSKLRSCVKEKHIWIDYLDCQEAIARAWKNFQSIIHPIVGIEDMHTIYNYDE